MCKVLFLVLLSCLMTFGQSSTARNPNFGANKIAGGATLPASCTDSQLYWKTNVGVYQCISGAWRRMAALDANENFSIGTTVLLDAAWGVLVPGKDYTSGPVDVQTVGFYWNNSAGALTFNLPSLAAFDFSKNVQPQFCIGNQDGKSGIITVRAPANTTISVSGTPGDAGGALVSAGALGEMKCFIGTSATTYKAVGGEGTWTPKVWYANYLYRKELAIPAGAVTGDLTNFPVYVSLAGDADLAAHAQPDGSDIVFTADDKVTVLPFEVPRRVRGLLMNDGAWNRNTSPRAIKVGTKVFIAAQSRLGYPYVVSYDLVTGERAASGGLFSGGSLEWDDHNHASLLALPDGRIAAFYQSHNGSAFYRITENPGDIRTWGSEQNWTAAGDLVVHAYAQVFYLSGSDKILVFFRGGPTAASRQPYMAVTTPAKLQTNTWESVTQWLTTGQDYPYAKFISNGVDKIHFVTTESHPNDSQTNLWGGYYSNGSWYKPDGTLIGAAMPITVTSFQKVYDHATSGPCMAYDLALDGNGYPVAVYAAYPGAIHDSAPDHRYRYARWTGSAWEDYEITAAGSSMAVRDPGSAQEFYSGGVGLDHSNPDIVYLSRNNTGIGKFVAERWVTEDGGATWNYVTLAEDPTLGYYRPTFTSGAASNDPLAVMWMKGDYGTFDGSEGGADYYTQIVTLGEHLETKDQSWLKVAAVRLPNITAAAGAKFYMYYGRTNSPDLSNAPAVWADAEFAVQGASYDAGNNYLESKSGALKFLGRLPIVQEIAGKAGPAIHFPNAQRIPLGAFDLASRRTLSIMGWVKGANGYIISNLGSDTSKAGMYLRVHSTSHKLDMWMRDSAGAAISGVFEPVVFDADTWHHIAVVFDADNGGWKAWIDGVQSPTVRSSQGFAEKASDSWDLGYCAFANQSFNGAIEKMRVYAGALAEAQIKADYAAGFTPETFIERGAEEPR